MIEQVNEISEEQNPLKCAGLERLMDTVSAMKMSFIQ